MCLSEAGTKPSGQAGSSPIQRFRLVGEGKMSYVALIMKFNTFDIRVHMTFLFSTASHLIQWPCLPWEMALAHLSVSYCRHTSSTPHSHRSVFCIFSGSSHSSTAKSPSALLDMAQYVSVLEGRFCIEHCSGWGQFSSCGQCWSNFSFHKVPRFGECHLQSCTL